MTGTTLEKEMKNDGQDGQPGSDAALTVLFGCFSKETFRSDWRDTHDPNTLEEFEKWIREYSQRIEAVGEPGRWDLELLREAWKRAGENPRVRP